MKRVFTEIDTNKRNVFHDGLSRKKNTLPAYRSQGGGDHLISPGSTASGAEKLNANP
ncbi:hypothetical protein KB20921_31020 [Edwardsiella ictaluri]|nr:hypothetical protein KH20906_30920 [Edwardsiella ictaluri]BEI03841.1 hypothetical protein KB20921_31020 [Edwardsiella ictaluri]BEI07297.1 hypothetical protein KH201010_30830 [Edwardsiella ictaluri]BEI10769.1 hypothetical protein STU22726_31000 [Edwardsiella ictaluri]BEI14248.1 hypothetical protein STU22816_31010 [Edwardsiella ictaluri]